jgi:hypothetical protein
MSTASLTPADRIRRVRFWLVLFTVGLVVSGITAFPLETEVSTLLTVTRGTPLPDWLPGLDSWIAFVDRGLRETNDKYPFLAYGTDWLAFAHLAIAVAFWGPIKDPVRNEWVIRFGMIACAGIIPLALIAGPVRGIPFYWQCIDMSFGVFGVVPLVLAYRYVRPLLDRPATASPQTN